MMIAQCGVCFFSVLWGQRSGLKIAALQFFWKKCMEELGYLTKGVAMKTLNLAVAHDYLNDDLP